MVCLDTSVLIALLRKEEEAMKRLEKEALQATRVSITPINLCELYAGAFGSRNPNKELAKVEELVNLLDVLQFTLDASKKYGERVNQAPLRNEPIGDFDLITACIAMSYGEPLATRNIKHFSRVPGLVVEEW